MSPWIYLRNFRLFIVCIFGVIYTNTNSESYPGLSPGKILEPFFNFGVFDHPCSIYFSRTASAVSSRKICFKWIDVCFCYSAYFCLIRGSGRDCRPWTFLRIIHAFGVFYRLFIIICFLNGFRLLSRKKWKSVCVLMYCIICVFVFVF